MNVVQIYLGGRAVSTKELLGAGQSYLRQTHAVCCVKNG